MPNIKRTEFRPPYQSDANKIRFAARGAVKQDDRYRRLWLYTASILVSLALVVGLFYIIDNSHRIAENPFREEEYFDDLSDLIEVVDDSVIELEPAKTAPAYAPPAPARAKAPAPVAKRTPAHARPAPAQAAYDDDDEFAVEGYYDDDLYGADEEYLAAEFPMEVGKPAKPAAGKETASIYQNLYYIEEEEAPMPTSYTTTPLEDARNDYHKHVLENGRYANVLGSVKFTFFERGAADAIDEMREINRYWNTFRNLTYAAYYGPDGSLKYGIDYDQFAADEQALRFHSNANFDFYEYQYNRFAMEYEFAAHAGVDLYDTLEKELQTLGSPARKLQLLESMRNLMLVMGGSETVLQKIYERDEALRSGQTATAGAGEEIIYVEQPATYEISDEMLAPPAAYGISDEMMAPPAAQPQTDGDYYAEEVETYSDDDYDDASPEYEEYDDYEEVYDN